MKIALCAVQIPYMRGGAEYHFDSLYTEMCKRNIEVEYVKIPFKWYPPEEIINHSLVWRLFDLSEANGQKIDGVIAQKFPAYLVKHQKKVLWLDHQHRVAYDLAHSPFDDLSTHGKIGEIVRNKIITMDNVALSEAKKIFTISQVVTDRLMRYNQIIGETLIIPPPHLGKYHSQGYGNYIFYPSRLDPIKRQDLVVKAMKDVHPDLRLVLTGTGPYYEKYLALAEELGVSDRIDFLGFVSDEKLLDLYSNAFCVVFTPLDEDYGYVTIEAFLSQRPVITCSDSGGPLAFVEDSKNGCIASPTPEDISRKINSLYNNYQVQEMGYAGYLKIQSLGLSWDSIIQKLLEPFR